MGTVTKAKTLKSNKAHSVYIARGRHCDAEMARQPALVRAIKSEMASQEFRVRVEFNKSSEFLERYPDMKSKTTRSTRENEKPKDGKGGKDAQAELITPASNYDTGKNYLEQPCEAVASMIAKADAEDDLKTATIHVWVSKEVRASLSRTHALRSTATS